ncbi:MAG: hypothetical protein A3J83_08315 [Elusimicrobia bacterium RIFOXYA2_FULL_40_6]|nr:MAG: hypothetical protein A3J83_08315 [Elusimicrobia bacterium RIFOXYA2_FULL_40_6]
MKKFILIILAPIVLLPSISFSQKENLKYLLNAQSLNGYTGNIITPSPSIANTNKFSFGLHKFNIGITYGINPSLEGGIYLNLNEFSSSINGTYDQIRSTSVALHAKYNIIKQFADDQPLDLSAGLYRKTLYFVAGKQFEGFFYINIQSGVDLYFSEERKLGYFIVFSKPTKYSNFIFDYKSYTGQSNIGWRVLLSPDVKLDLFLINVHQLKNAFENFMFGLTLTS